MDLYINRSMTIAPRQFENIKPSVSITLKDINPEKTGELYKSVDTLVNNLFKLEFLNQYSIFKDIKEYGYDEYSYKITNDIDNIVEELNESINKISIELKKDEKF